MSLICTFECHEQPSKKKYDSLNMENKHKIFRPGFFFPSLLINPPESAVMGCIWDKEGAELSRDSQCELVNVNMWKLHVPSWKSHTVSGLRVCKAFLKILISAACKVIFWRNHGFCFWTINIKSLGCFFYPWMVIFRSKFAEKLYFQNN